MTGIVFDIQRFSLHDGPGIRTTIFLKGCQLSCRWCSNPESQSLQPQLGFAARICQHCLACLEVCPTQAHQHKNGWHVLDFTLCSHCGDCVSVCPHYALKMFGKKMNVDEVLNVVIKDRAYYQKSGGGLTLSGGDPTYQFEFAQALLNAAKTENIHTCIETAGYVEQDKLEQLVPLVDCFLFDFKLADAKLMRQYVGGSMDIILNNLKMLNETDASIILRCPIIPGINDTREHFRRIADLSQMRNITKTEILPYHDFGRSKAAEIGQAWKMEEKSVDDKVANKWIEELKKLNCPNVERG